jgi:uncharacterized RDD family membrane protein YckC
MSQTDPYSPPQASLGGLTPSEQHDRENGVLHYSTFWQRVGATLIDTLIVLPLFLIEYVFGEQSRMVPLYLLVATELIGAYFFVFMVLRHGGSPGKLLLGLRIANLDGSRVTLKAVAMRYFPLWAVNLAIAAMTVMAGLGMTDEAYKALEYLERSDAMEAQMPLIEPLTWLMMIWLAASAATLLANAKRRTLHDFIAGTVVVRK